LEQSNDLRCNPDSSFFLPRTHKSQAWYSYVLYERRKRLYNPAEFTSESIQHDRSQSTITIWITRLINGSQPKIIRPNLSPLMGEKQAVEERSRRCCRRETDAPLHVAVFAIKWDDRKGDHEMGAMACVLRYRFVPTSWQSSRRACASFLVSGSIHMDQPRPLILI
jgi:hypothetical protein